MSPEGPGAPARAGRLGGAYPALAALALYCAAACALLFPALAGDQVLSAAGDFVHSALFPEALRARATEDAHSLSDSAQCFVPWQRFAADALARDGRLPLWKDTAGAGAPLLGNGQSAPFYPTNLLALLLGAPAGILAVQALLKLVAGAFCAWLLARHLGLSFLASLLCGLVFGFGGFQMAWFLHPLSNVSLLLPLLIVAADRLVLRPSPARAACVALVAALQHLGGHPETAFHCQVAVLALGVARSVSLRAEPGAARVLRRCAWLVAGLLGGALLAAVQLLPLLEYMGQSATLARRQQWAGEPVPSHALTAAGFAAAFLVGLLALRQLLRGRRSAVAGAVLLFVATGAGVLAGLAAGMRFTFPTVLASDWFGSTRQFGGSGSYLEQTGAFIGAALPLVVLGLLAGRSRGIAKAAGVVLCIGWLAGFQAPVLSDALDGLPLFRITLNTRLQLLALLAGAVLAGAGLDALRDATRSARDRVRLVLLLLLPLLAADAALAAAVRLDLVSAADAPRRSEGSVLVEARPLPAQLVDPLLPALLPADPAEPVQTARGYVKLPAPPADIRLLHGGGNASVEAVWRAAPIGAVPSPAGATPPATPARQGSDGPTPGLYVFRAVVPQRDLPPGPSVVRVWAALPGRGTAVSGLIAGFEAPATRWPFPARPAPGGSTVLILLLGLLVLGGAALAPRRGPPLVALRIALLLLVAGSLLPFAAGLVTMVPRELFYPSSPAIEALRRAAPQGRILALAAHVFPPEIPTAYGIADLRSYDGIGSERVERVVDVALGRQRREPSETWRESGGEPDFALLGVLAVRDLVALDPPREGFARIPDGGSGALEADCPIVENPQYLPRARLVSGAVIEPDDGRALALLRQPEFRRDRDVVLAAGEARAAGAEAGSAHIASSRPDQLTVEIAPAAPGWLVLADTFYPGWKASVDGQPREILRANVALRAVAVSPGERVVEFRYEPLSWSAGLAVSGLALVLVAGALVFGRRAGQRAPGSALEARLEAGPGSASSARTRSQ